MSQTVSLFEELKNGGYDACLVSTFSVDFPFYEDVLLRKMQSSGINHHILFADKGMSLAAMNERPPCKIGSHYLFAPMDCPGAFHPKILLLLGKNKGLLAIGSHNATLSGFGQNLEVTNVLRITIGKNEEYLSVFQQAFNAFKEWLTSYGSDLSSTIRENLERTVHLSPWLHKPVPESNQSQSKLLFTSRTTASLWEQLQPYLPAHITEILGVSAFFDKQLAFVNALSSISEGVPVIGIQPNTVSAPDSLVTNTAIKLVDVGTVEAIHQSKHYVHAKLFYLMGDEKIFVSGSANFSRPAWLSDGDKRNAEAVLVIQGDDAEQAAIALSLPELNKANSVQEITAQQNEDIDKPTTSVNLMLVDDAGGDYVAVPIQTEWPDTHRLAYFESFGIGNNISATKSGQLWRIPREELKDGELISVVSGNDVIARIVVLNIAQLHHNSSAGKERELQQAIGSLNSDNPDLELFFKCFGQIMPTEKDSKKTNRIGAGAKIAASESEEPTSLLADLETTAVKRAKSGKARCSEGDIGLMLDMLLYSLGSGNRNDSAKAFGEDALGRNEEDLIGSEESGDVFLQDGLPTAVDDDALKAKADKACQRKLQNILKRAEVFEVSSRNPSEETLRQSVPVVLGILVFIHELYISQAKQNPEPREWVTAELLLDLNDFLFLSILSEKNPVDLSERLDPHSVYLSDEWARLLGYAAWVAYHADITLKSRLPLSATKDEKNLLRWKNACWLYLAQRINADEVATETAVKLIAPEGKQAEAWLNMLVMAGLELKTSQRLPIDSGFGLAKSPKKGFEGYKLVTEIEGDSFRLANINDIDNPSKFKAGYIDVYGVES